MGAFLFMLWEWLGKQPEIKILVAKAALRVVLFLQRFRWKHNTNTVNQLIRNASRPGGISLNESSFGLGVMLTDKKVRIRPLRKYVLWGRVLEYKIESLFSPPCKLNQEQLRYYLKEYLVRAATLKAFGLRREIKPLMLRIPG